MDDRQLCGLSQFGGKDWLQLQYVVFCANSNSNKEGRKKRRGENSKWKQKLNITDLSITWYREADRKIYEFIIWDMAVWKPQMKRSLTKCACLCFSFSNSMQSNSMFFDEDTNTKARQQQLTSVKCNYVVYVPLTFIVLFFKFRPVKLHLISAWFKD